MPATPYQPESKPSIPLNQWLVGLYSSLSWFQWAVIASILAHILTTAYLGIHGSHVWRQADSDAHILGFLQEEGLGPLQNFWGVRRIYDIPVYQLIVALLSTTLHLEPLAAARLLNCFLYSLSAVAGIYIVRRFTTRGGTAFQVLFSASPFFLHYYTTPLSDILSIALSLICLAAIFSGPSLHPALLLFWIIAVLIKSPIPFVFLLFAWTLHLLPLVGSRSTSLPRPARRVLLAYSALGVVFAVSAEKIRGFLADRDTSSAFAQDPSHYFGSLEQRLSQSTFLRAVERHIFSDLPPDPIFDRLRILVLLLAPIVLCSVIASRLARAYWCACLVSLVVPWVVFTNLYLLHDYYQLPGQFLLVGGVAISLSEALGKLLGNRRRAEKLVFRAQIIALLALWAVIPKLACLSRILSVGEWTAIQSLLKDVSSSIDNL